MRVRNSIALTVAFMVSVAMYAAAPPAYYNTAKGNSGNALRIALMNIIDDHIDNGYSGLWVTYRTSDVTSAGKIWDIYSTCTFTPGSSQCGSYTNICDCYNREHTVPQSWFGEASPMRNDAFHVYPTDGKVNSNRGNDPYGECANGTTWANALGKSGTSTFRGPGGEAYNGRVFEPVDEYKGDLARTYFYMVTRYANTNFTSGTGGSCFAYSAAGNPKANLKPYAVALFLKWHRQDPVSPKELARNDAIYARQNNRNPFIDHPELAEYLWGDSIGRVWNGTPITNVEIINADDLIVAPTPANSFIQIQSDGNSQFSYEIYNLQSIISKRGVAESGEQIDVSDLSSGFYFIRLKVGDAYVTKKIIIFR